jgi:hypothetical protein
MQMTTDVRTQNPEGQVLTLSTSHLLFLAVFLVGVLCFETGAQCITQDDLELTVILLYLPQSAGIVEFLDALLAGCSARASRLELLRPGSMPSAALLVVCRSVPSETSCDLSVNPLASSRAEKKEIKEWMHSEERKPRDLGRKVPICSRCQPPLPS